MPRASSLAPHGKTSMAPQLWARQLAAGAWGDHRGDDGPGPGDARRRRPAGAPRERTGRRARDRRAVRRARRPVRDHRLLGRFGRRGRPARGRAPTPSRGAPARRVRRGRARGRPDRIARAGRGGRRGEGRRRRGRAAPGGRRRLRGDPGPGPFAVRAGVGRRVPGHPADGDDALPRGWPPRGGGDRERGGQPLLRSRRRAPARRLARRAPTVRVLLRAGCTVTHDDGLYARGSPFADAPPEDRFRAAFEARGAVLSRPEPDVAVVGIGARDVPDDIEPPIAIATDDGHGPPAGAAWCAA